LAEAAAGDQTLIYQESARELATSHLAALVDNKQWQDGLVFADQVVWQEPNYGPYLVAKIELNLALGDRQQALIQLERLSYLPGFETRVQEFNDQLQVASNAVVGPRTVDLQRVNNHWLVPVTVDNQDQLALIIDTGASLTVVSENTFAQMGAGSAYLRSVTMNTAGGPTSAEVYRVQRFQLGGFQLREVEFAVMPLTGLQGDGLLGMNVLQQFAFNIDTSANKLTLAQP
jgi:clan AA aspartic protease (TIGR02281 family)